MSVSKEVPVRAYPPGRRLVHNATGADLNAGTLVRFTGTLTDGVPNIEATSAIVADADDTISGSSEWDGVLYEDIKNGKDGIMLEGEGWEVELTANAAISVGDKVIADANGRIQSFPTPPDVGAPAAGAWRLRLYILVGKALESASAAGDKIKVRLRRSVITLFRQG